MKNYREPGDVITVVAPSGGVVSGSAYLIGALFGVASASAAEGDEFALATFGVFELPKTSALAIAAGDKVYWDDTAKVVNKTASGNTLVGVATAAAANPSSVVNVRLDGAAR